MNLKSVFASLKLPLISGRKSSSKAQLKVVFHLQFRNLEGAPDYILKQKISVGRKTGDVVIDDASLGDLHATFLNNGNMISVMDHGSSLGTKVNGKLIPKARHIIIDESDEILLGELVVRLVAFEEEWEEMPLPDLPDLDVIEEKKDSTGVLKNVTLMTPQIDDERYDSGTEVKQETKKNLSPISGLKKYMVGLKRKKEATFLKGKKSTLIFDPKTANSFFRVLAFFADLMVVQVILTVLSPFNDLQIFFSDLNRFVTEVIWPEIFGLIAMLDIGKYIEEWSFIIDGLKDFFSTVQKDFDILAYFWTYVFVRLLTALFFGVSIGSILVGLRGTGSFLLNRLGGLVREFLGILFAPLILPDLPALISKRTLKEFLTNTNVIVMSRLGILIYVLIFYPLLMAAVLISPLFKGLTIREPISVSSHKAKQAKDVPGSEAIELRKYVSETMLFSLEAPTQKWMIVPDFKLFQEEGKRKLVLSNLIINKESGKQVRFSELREFDWHRLLGLCLKHNHFIHEQFPETFSFVQSESLKDKSFIKNKTSQSPQFVGEISQIVDISFKLGPDNLLEHIQEYGPILQGWVDFRDSLISLIGYETMTDLEFLSLGKTTFIKAVINHTKPTEIFIPINRLRGRVFALEYNSNDDLRDLGKDLVTDLFGKADFNFGQQTSNEGSSAFSVNDILTLSQNKNFHWTDEKVERVFAYYYETLEKLPLAEEGYRTIVLESLKHFQKVLEEVKVKLAKAEAPDQVSIESVEKLSTKLADLAVNPAFPAPIATQPLPSPQPQQKNK